MEPYQEYAHRPPLETTGKIEQLTPDMAHAKLLARIEQIEDNQRKSVRNVDDGDRAEVRLRERLEKLEERLRKMRSDKLDLLPANEKLTHIRLRLENLEEITRKFDKSIKHLHGALGRNNKQIARLENPEGYEERAEPETPAEPEKIADFLSPGEKDDIERGTTNMPAHEARAIFMIAGKLQKLASRIEQIEKIAPKESTDEGARGVGEPMETQDAIAHTIAGMDYKLAEILSHLQKFDMERTDERARGADEVAVDYAGGFEPPAAFMRELIDFPRDPRRSPAGGLREFIDHTLWGKADSETLAKTLFSDGQISPAIKEAITFVSDGLRIISRAVSEHDFFVREYLREGARKQGARGGWREEAERQGISEKWMKFFQELQEKHLAEKKDDGARGYKMSEPPADTEWQAQPQLVVELRFDLYTAFDQEANAYLSYCPEIGQMDEGDSVSEARVAMGEGAKLLLESTIQRILTDKK